MLGIVGDSGTGKTALTRGVVRILGHNGVTPICLDDYHRYSRADRLSLGLAAADPAANDLTMMADHLVTLRAGGTIRKPVYDHRSGVLRSAESVAATGLVVAYGMLTLTPPHLASLFDLTVFLDPDDELYHAWRMGRDTSERGYVAEQVLAQRPTNDLAAARYVAGQRRYADVVVRFHGEREAVPDVELTLRQTPATASLAPLLGCIERGDCAGATLERAIRDRDGRVSDRVCIGAELDAAAHAELIAAIWPPYPGAPELPRDQLGVPRPGAPRSPLLAIAQVIIASMLAHAAHRARESV